jgi:hypothetical protein
MLFKETVADYCENHTEHTDTVRTSQETHYVSATETNRLMLFGETVAVYQVRVRVTLRLTVSQSVSMSWCRAQSRTIDQSLLSP